MSDRSPKLLLAGGILLLSGICRAGGGATKSKEGQSPVLLPAVPVTGTGSNYKLNTVTVDGAKRIPGTDSNFRDTNLGVNPIRTGPQGTVQDLRRRQDQPVVNGGVQYFPEGQFQSGPEPGTQKVSPAPSTDQKTSAIAPSRFNAPPANSGRGAPPASGTLGTAASEIKKVQDDEAGVSALKAVFDAALRSGVKTAESGARAPVSGKVQQVSERISQTVGIANEASPHDAPDLYRSAIKTAEEAAVQRVLASEAAKAATRTIMGYAFRKAEGSLNELGKDVSRAAAEGPAGDKEVERTIGSSKRRTQGSLDKWESLVGPIAGLSRLKDFIRAVQAEAREAAKEGSSKKVSPPRISIERQGSSFAAKLPVAQLPKGLALGFALRGPGVSPGGSSGWSETYLAFRGNPSPSDHYRLLRSNGVGVFRAGGYWAKATLRGSWERLRAKRSPAMEGKKLKALAETIGREYFSARSLLARTASAPMRMTEVEALLGYASAMAENYGRLAGDDSGIEAVAGIGREISRERDLLGPVGRDQASPRIQALVRSSPGNTLAHWVERLHEAADDRMARPASQAPGHEALAEGTPRGPSQAELKSLARLLAELKADRGAARDMAAEIQSLDPDPSHFTTIASPRVDSGDFWAQELLQRLKGGRPVRFMVLRDLKTGRLAYGRAESGASAATLQSLSAKTLSALLER